ncbi:CPXCG motif-containing cysteine-rich protein [bacterium]|jgi:hypothetical protein|nr:MAG: CPXCG motif-containing cysteine-rich protein [bacterium]
MLANATFSCAFCGEINTTTVDLEGGETQQYIEDCQVCCRPNSLYVTGNARSGEAWIEAFSDDD